MASNHHASRLRYRLSSVLGTLLVCVILVASAWMGEYFPHREAVLFHSGEQNLIQTDTWLISSSESTPANLSNPIFSPDSSAESFEDVLVGPDPKIERRILSLFAQAETELLVNVYLLTAPSTIDALIAAKKRGVDVRVILEKDPYKLPGSNRVARDKLLSAGVSVFSSRDDFAYTHAKYAVADGRNYVFSTGNYTKSTFSKNREFFVFGNHPESAKFLHSVFESDFRGSPFVGYIPDRFYLAPVDARSKILSFVARSKKSVTVFAPSVSDKEFINTLNEVASKGKTVRVCLLKNASAADLARFGRGISVVRSSRAQLHAKTVWIDGRELLVGSANFTRNSLDNNREVGAVFGSEKVIRTYETTLFRDCKW